MTHEKTIICTVIEGEQFKATTPHVPHLVGVGSTEGRAVTALILAIRKHIAEAGDKPVPWIASPNVPSSKDMIVKPLTGLWPAKIAAPVPAKPTKESPVTQAKA